MLTNPAAWPGERRRRYRNVFFAVFVIGALLGFITPSPILYAITLIGTIGYVWLLERPATQGSTPNLFETKDDERE